MVRLEFRWVRRGDYITLSNSIPNFDCTPTMTMVQHTRRAYSGRIQRIQSIHPVPSRLQHQSSHPVHWSIRPTMSIQCRWSMCTERRTPRSGHCIRPGPTCIRRRCNGHPDQSSRCCIRCCSPRCSRRPSCSRSSRHLKNCFYEKWFLHNKWCDSSPRLYEMGDTRRLYPTLL